MNNQQFRKLVLDTPRAERSDGSSSNDTRGTMGPPPKTSLGSKQRSFIPMTPRAVSTQSNFSQQLAAHNAPPTKKFKSSVPKGIKLGQGYIDRAKARENEEVDAEIAERERRLEALKELARNPETGEIDMDLVIQQSKALGGDVKGTHLVKGLDFALLERVRRGEDVLGISDGKNKRDDFKGDKPTKNDEQLEQELDKVLDKVVVPVEKEKVKKAGHKVTREEMLAELKRQKSAAAAASKTAAAPPVSHLDSRFKKIGQPKPKKETKEKKKTKAKESDSDAKASKPSPALGMLPPILPTPKPEINDGEDDLDIFDDVGRDYDPLADLGDDDDSDSDTSANEEKSPKLTSKKPEKQEQSQDMGSTNKSSSPPQPPRPKPNYFLESDDDKEETYQPVASASALLAQNPDLAAALAKAAKLAEKGGSISASAEELEKQKKRKAMLENFDRDAMDMDMGFGGSRDWGEDEEEFVEGSKGGKKRKRGPKGPKKGDKNNAEIISRIASEKFGKG